MLLWGRNQLKFRNHQLVIPLMYFLPPRLQMGFDDFVRIGSFRSMHPAVLHRAAGNVSTRKAMTKVRLGLRFSFDVSMCYVCKLLFWNMVTSSNSAIWVNCSHVTSGQNYLPSHGTKQMFHSLGFDAHNDFGGIWEEVWALKTQELTDVFETLGRGAIADILLGKMLLFVGLLVGGLIRCPV